MRRLTFILALVACVLGPWQDCQREPCKGCLDALVGSTDGDR